MEQHGGGTEMPSMQGAAAFLLAKSQHFRPRNMDLSHDMGWSEAFIVDAEGLLYEACTAAARPLELGQPLQVGVHRSEHYCASLQRIYGFCFFHGPPRCLY